MSASSSPLARSLLLAALLLLATAATGRKTPSPSPQPQPGDDASVGDALAIEAEVPSGHHRLLQTVTVSIANCSTTSTTAAAVLECTNAVRLNPSIMRNVSCWSAISATLTPRKRLLSNSALTLAASRHNNLMVSTGTMSHQLPGEQSLGSRITAAGYTWGRVAENIAVGYTSARAVVAGWLCSDGHRANMFACNMESIGVATGRNATTGRRFYTQNFGCPLGKTCNSC